jgi:hypothetical protein
VHADEHHGKHTTVVVTGSNLSHSGCGEGAFLTGQHALWIDYGPKIEDAQIDNHILVKETRDCSLEMSGQLRNIDEISPKSPTMGVVKFAECPSMCEKRARR